ncbi:hypothetical protein GGF31_007582 [Allomyces arbusculus]|nr:hypothetical protein GGF31_007582 [Allomyces arbusculus]
MCNEDAPRVIRGFREEVQGLKLLTEQLDQAKSRNAEIEAIVAQQDLRVRADHQSEIDDVKCNISKTETICQSTGLRMKIQVLEQKNMLYTDKIEDLESTVRIVSLSIYKSWKLCRKTQGEERKA